MRFVKSVIVGLLTAVVAGALAVGLAAGMAGFAWQWRRGRRAELQNAG